MGRNFPQGRYGQTGSCNVVPWLASPASTMRGSCAHGQPLHCRNPSALGIAQSKAPFLGQLNLSHPLTSSRGDRLQSPDSFYRTTSSFRTRLA